MLGWHNVASCPSSPSEGDDGLRGFERQVRLLARAGTVVPLGPALQRLAEGRRLPRRAVAITFDDGYRDNLEHAVPVLERLGLPATFFLVPGLLSRRVAAWWELTGWAVGGAAGDAVWDDAPLPRDPRERRRFTLALNERLKRLTRAERECRVAELALATRPSPAFPGDLFLDWEGARELAARGFEVGSHTASHPILANEAPEEQARELSDSRRELEDRLGRSVPLLAYPNGTTRDYDRHTLAAAAEAGYSHAVTTVWGWNGPATPRHEIRRMLVSPHKGPEGLARALASGLPRLGDRL